MNIPRLSVRNPVAVNLVMVAVLLVGGYSWVTLVREFFPNTSSDRVLVTVVYPGATPEEIEKSVTRVVEREIENIEDVKRITSQVYEGLTQITLELEEDADRDRVLNDVRGEIDKVKADLPDGAEEPEVMEARPTLPVIAVVLHGEVPERVLHDAILKVRDEVLDLPDVTEAIVTGFRKREFLIEILPERLETFGLTFEEVGRAVTASNLDVPGGLLKGDRSNVRVRTVGEEQAALAIEELVVRTNVDGSAVLLRDVARIRDAFEDRVDRGRFWIRGDDEPGTRSDEPETAIGSARSRAATVTVFKTPEQDAIKISKAVKAYAANRPAFAGGALELSLSTDLARFIEQRLDLVGRNARTGLILVLITLAVFLELRIAFWVAVGLVFSFAGTFVLMSLTGTTINLISLFGLIIVLGLIVDDAIIIGENVFRLLRSGMHPKQAAVIGAGQVGAPVVAAVLTTCVAFAPLAFIEGRMGTFLGVLPVVVVCALSVSLVEAFYILPAHLAHAPKKGTGPIARAYDRFNEAKHYLFEVLLPGILERQLRFILRWRYISAAVALAALVAAAGLVAGGVVPFVLLQHTDAETVTASLEMTAGTPEEETLATLGIAERAAAAQPEVSSAFSVHGAMFGDWGGSVYGGDAATIGMVNVELLPAEVREERGLDPSPKVLARMRLATADLPGVRKLSWSGRSGGPGGPDIEVLVRGEELVEIQPLVASIREELSSYAGVDEIYDDLELGKLEARLALKPAGRLLGLTTQGLAIQVRHALFGIEAQDLQIGDEEVTVRVVLPEQARSSLDDLRRLRIAVPSGRRVPLEEVATVTTTRGYASITRVDGKRAVKITAEVDQDVTNAGDVTRSLAESLKDVPSANPGTTVTFEGENKETRESMGSLILLFPAALLAIFSIVAVVFRSYTQPIIVMSVIPYALVGAVVGHFLMGYPLTLLSVIGIVALSGIVVNDGLILVDFANRSRRSGESALESVVGAARARLRPILLTSITTIAGLSPLMLERSFQAKFLIPMAISIVFGLAFATALTLMLLPTFYMIFEDIGASLRWIWFGRRERKREEEGILIADLPSSES